MGQELERPEAGRTTYTISGEEWVVIQITYNQDGGERSINMTMMPLEQAKQRYEYHGHA